MRFVFHLLTSWSRVVGALYAYFGVQQWSIKWFSSSFIPSSFLSFLPCLPSCFLSLTLGGVTIDKSDPSMVEALVGQTVVLPCRVRPPPSSTVIVEWRRDGVPLSTHRSDTVHHYSFEFIISVFDYLSCFSRHHQQPNGSLLVGPLSKSDAGWFLCVATRERERDHRYIYLSVTGSVPYHCSFSSCCVCKSWGQEQT